MSYLYYFKLLIAVSVLRNFIFLSLSSPLSKKFKVLYDFGKLNQLYIQSIMSNVAITMSKIGKYESSVFCKQDRYKDGYSSMECIINDPVNSS